MSGHLALRCKKGRKGGGCWDVLVIFRVLVVRMMNKVRTYIFLKKTCANLFILFTCVHMTPQIHCISVLEHFCRPQLMFDCTHKAITHP